MSFSKIFTDDEIIAAFNKARCITDIDKIRESIRIYYYHGIYCELKCGEYSVSQLFRVYNNMREEEMADVRKELLEQKRKDLHELLKGTPYIIDIDNNYIDGQLNSWEYLEGSLFAAEVVRIMYMRNPTLSAEESAI
jgi:hypothetical protein